MSCSIFNVLYCFELKKRAANKEKATCFFKDYLCLFLFMNVSTPSTYILHLCSCEGVPPFPFCSLGEL